MCSTRSCCCALLPTLFICAVFIRSGFYCYCVLVLCKDRCCFSCALVLRNDNFCCCCALMLLFIAMCYRTVAVRWFSCVLVGVVVLLLLCVSLVFMDLLCAAALDGLLYAGVVDWLLCAGAFD